MALQASDWLMIGGLGAIWLGIQIVVVGRPPRALRRGPQPSAPKGTPQHIVQALNAVVRQGVNTPDTIKALAAEGSEPAPPMNPEEFRAKFNADYARLDKLIKTINVRVQ